MWLRSLAQSARRQSASIGEQTNTERASAVRTSVDGVGLNPPASPHALPSTPTQRNITSRAARGSIAGVVAMLQARRASREEDASFCKGIRRSLAEGGHADPPGLLQGRLSRLDRTQSSEQEVHVNVKCSKPKRNRNSKRARAILARSTSRSTVPPQEMDTWQGPPKMEFELGDTVASVALSDDDSMFAAGTIDRVARVWSAAGEELATVRKMQTAPLRSCQYGVRPRTQCVTPALLRGRCARRLSSPRSLSSRGFSWSAQ